MQIKKITENPKLTDIVLIELETPDSDGCFLSNPYKVDSVKIFYVERNYASSSNNDEYQEKHYNTALLNKTIAAEKKACETPSETNILKAQQLRQELEATATMSEFFYEEALPVKIIGNKDFPAWLSSDIENSYIENVEEDEDGNLIYGRYQYEWTPEGMREGDYFVCYTWTPNAGGDSLSNNFKFTLLGDTRLTTSIPTHFTVDDKYYNLLTTYTPEMFWHYLSETDKTPDVLDKLNKAVAQGFTFIENFVNQLIDLHDANVVPEYYLPLLANYFNLALKTNDSTLWRRQIKNAVPLYKKKGTLKGITEALSQINVKLNSLTKLWQVSSLYTYQEGFLVSDDNQTEFVLNKMPLPVDIDNFDLKLIPAGETEYITLDSSYVDFVTVDGFSKMVWIGDTLSIGPISLLLGDFILVLYKHTEIPGETEQNIENYIRSLPLMDQRDELITDYPLKNWNIRLIEENDPFFSLIVITKHPYYDFVVFGSIRTEFPYSENIYNMDSYNGSLRKSTNPCHIDKDFVEECNYCQSSSFNINVEIENLTNEKIIEVQDILTEYAPFHAVLHSLNFSGGINDYVQPPEQELEILLNIDRNENVFYLGSSNDDFYRTIKLGLTTNAILRNELATEEEIVSYDTGTIFNDYVVLFSPNEKLDRVGINKDHSTILEVLSPSVNAGTYQIYDPVNNTATITHISEPYNTSNFNFRILNEITTGTSCNIYQDNIYYLTDESDEFKLLGLESLWDVNNNNGSGPFKVVISTYSNSPYTIENILSNGSLILNNNIDVLPTSTVTDVTYSIRNSNEITIYTGTCTLSNKKRGRVVIADNNLTDIREFTDSQNCYFIYSDVQYKITGYLTGSENEFYINDYNSGDIGGTNLRIVSRLIDNQIGSFSYKGLKLETATNYETTLNIQNGKNAPAIPVENDCFMENFIVFINDDPYFIKDIDGTLITLEGELNYWKTYSGGGTSVSFSIKKYVKNTIDINGSEYNFIDRRGVNKITMTTDTTDSQEFETLSNPFNNTINQSHEIGYEIEYDNGQKVTTII
jgi:hypothetical protein